MFIGGDKSFAGTCDAGDGIAFTGNMWQYWCAVLNFTIHFTVKSNWLLGCNYQQCQSSEIGPHSIIAEVKLY